MRTPFARLDVRILKRRVLAREKVPRVVFHFPRDFRMRLQVAAKIRMLVQEARVVRQLWIFLQLVLYAGMGPEIAVEIPETRTIRRHSFFASHEIARVLFHFDPDFRMMAVEFLQCATLVDEFWIVDAFGMRLEFGLQLGMFLEEI